VTDRDRLWIWIGAPSFGDPTIGYVINPSSDDLFAQMGISGLNAGHYGMYVENHDSGTPSFSVANYRLDFTVVPEPAAPALLFLGATALVAFRRGFL
jgi:hypothetical protein